MIQTWILKQILPFIIGLVAGVGLIVGVQKLTKQEIRLECPAAAPCPACPATLGNELEKVKGKYITLNLHQNLQVAANGDSLIVKKIVDEVEAKIDAKLKELRIAKCK